MQKEMCNDLLSFQKFIKSNSRLFNKVISRVDFSDIHFALEDSGFTGFGRWRPSLLKFGKKMFNNAMV